MVYLDHAATTPIREEVYKAMVPYLTEEFGNPSSRYGLGFRAREAVENARAIIAKAINAEPDEIFFTSGGSEANSWAIKGIKANRVYASGIEHHSLLDACQVVGAEEIPVNMYGVIDRDRLSALMLAESLVSVMTVNNELGTINLIQVIADIAHKNHSLFHTDAVQAFGHMPLDVRGYGIDLLSASGHKIEGPKGIGFLYANKAAQTRLKPLINGGQQEQGLRGGTENVAAIVGLAKATELAVKEMSEVTDRHLSLKKMLENGIKELGGIINSPIISAPAILNFRIPGIKAEQLMAFMEEWGVFVSSGSACNSLSNEPSHVLKGVGLSDEAANSSIRVSLGRTTNDMDIKAFLSILHNFVELNNGQ